MYYAQKLELNPFMEGLKKRNPGEPEFHQAVYEVAQTVVPFINQNPKYIESRIFERMTEPDRVIIFRVCWEDDAGNIRVNRGYRIQFNNAKEKLEFIIQLKTIQRDSLLQSAEKYGCEFHQEQRPWNIPCDLAFPCATQNELNENDVKSLIANGCLAVSEGANMPTEPKAILLFQEGKRMFAPGKASNAGGVAVSGLEMTQNSTHMTWSREELEQRLQKIMNQIHKKCVEYGADKDNVDYVKGANLAGFVKVADAMLAYGVL